jgi:hypothetical protein
MTTVSIAEVTRLSFCFADVRIEMRDTPEKLGLVAIRSQAKRDASALARGRSPDSQVIAKPATFPFPWEQWLKKADSLAAHSGATVRDFHPLPFSLAVSDEHLGNVH